MRTHTLTIVVALVAVAGLAAVGASAHGGASYANETTTAGGNQTNSSGDMGGMMQMQMVDGGMVVNENTDDLPPGCSELAGTKNVTIEAGRQFAEPGNMFTYDADRIQVEPCTKVTVTLVNRDGVRHQWMIHGLPMQTYPMGMFNVEVQPGSRVTGTFIAPAGNQTLSTHCSLPQHEQKGMHMQVVVGDGGNSSGHGSDHSHARNDSGVNSGLSLPSVAALVGLFGVALAGVVRRE